MAAASAKKQQLRQRQRRGQEQRQRCRQRQARSQPLHQQMCEELESFGPSLLLPCAEAVATRCCLGAATLYSSGGLGSTPLQRLALFVAVALSAARVNLTTQQWITRR
ncbi:hypothetical protein Emed_005921 [Eimeria media]